MTKWPCIVDYNRIASIVSIAKPLLILIWWKSFLSRPYTLSRYVYSIEGRNWVGGTTVQQHVIWSVNLSLIIYSLQHLFLRKRIHVSWFPANNFLFHQPTFITSGISIFIWIDYPIILPPVFLRNKKIPNMLPPVFLNQFYKKSTTSFPQGTNPVIVT